MKNIFWLSFILAFVIVSCSDDDSAVPIDDEEDPTEDPIDDTDDEEEPIDSIVPIYNVADTNVQKIVNSFIEEAFFRSITLDTTNLILTYDSTLVANNCTFYSGIPAEGQVIQNEIVINPLITKWNNAQEQEAWWFHMLGHVLLYREHDNSLLPNGSDPKSLMIEGFVSLYGPCVYAINNSGVGCNDLSKRDYYIDELFLPNTPTPFWGN